MKEIPLTHGHVAIVDDADYEELSKFQWGCYHTRSTYYAKRDRQISGKRTTILMHRILMNAPPGKEVDHINGDGFDNRRCNLRICTRKLNVWHSRGRGRTKSPFKGISRGKRGRWYASIQANGKSHYLGTAPSAEAAARLYDAAAKKLHGDFAWLNFPGETS